MTYDNEYGTCTLLAGVCFSALRAAQFFHQIFFAQSSQRPRLDDCEWPTGHGCTDEADGRPPSLDMRTALPAAPRLVADAGRHSGVLARP